MSFLPWETGPPGEKNSESFLWGAFLPMKPVPPNGEPNFEGFPSSADCSPGGTHTHPDRSPRQRREKNRKIFQIIALRRSLDVSAVSLSSVLPGEKRPSEGGDSCLSLSPGEGSKTDDFPPRGEVSRCLSPREGPERRPLLPGEDRLLFSPLIPGGGKTFEDRSLPGEQTPNTAVPGGGEYGGTRPPPGEEV